MTTMKILSPGPLSTVQDGGRFGYMRTGFSPSGAMDTYSMKIANILTGNRPEEGVIEMTMMGMTVSFDGDAVIALTGAVKTFTENCVSGITANAEHCRELVEGSVGVITAICPQLGYAESADIAKTAIKTGQSVREVLKNREVPPGLLSVPLKEVCMSLRDGKNRGSRVAP